MNLALPILIATFLGTMLMPGCETAEPPPAQAATRPDQSADDSREERLARIDSMYAGYRAEAFAGVREIDPNSIAAVAPDRPVLLVDCREDDERAVSIIEGAISKAEFEANADRYRDRTVVAYCTIGYRSGVYVKSLQAQGLDAYNLEGGVLAWAHADRAFVDAQGHKTHRVHVYGAEWELLPSSHASVYDGKPDP